VVRAFGKANPRRQVVSKVEDAATCRPIPLEERSNLAHGIKEGRLLNIVDVTPPSGNDVSVLMKALNELRDRGVDAICISSAPPGSPRMDPLSLALLVQREVRLETVLHYVCSGGSLAAMQASLLGAHALGLRNLLMFDGDPLWVGDHINAAAIRDVDAIGSDRLLCGGCRGSCSLE
jgi:homocysteine S-methyltransferase